MALTPNQQQLRDFVQSVYLVVKNRYYDDLDSEDGQNFIKQVIDWTNQLLDELESETNPDGSPVDWLWTRQLGVTLGSATLGAASISLSASINHLLTDGQRYVQVLQDGSPVSNWAVVEPADISNQAYRITEDMVTVVGGSVVFSRPFRDYEDGGTIIGDAQAPLPRMSDSNVKILSTVKPKQLLILGVAKNATLPDIVQGKLSPSYVQKFNDLLAGAIARNNRTGRSQMAVRDDFSSIRGVY